MIILKLLAYMGLYFMGLATVYIVPMLISKGWKMGQYNALKEIESDKKKRGN